MTTYHHTQVGTLVLILLGLAIVFLIVVMVRIEVVVVGLVVLGVLLVCMVLFGSLTTEVTTEALRIRFGPGLIRKTFPLAEIRAVRVVRNRWYYGWGIRMTPHGWLYTVSGLDAVELEMKDGRRHRIGTDRPQELEAAIRAVGVQDG